MSTFERHYDESVMLPVKPEEIFSYIDDHSRFSSHMSKSSWMMGGGHMDVTVDDGKGQKVGSHIRLNGAVFGIPVSLDEVITQHEAPYVKSWRTVGIPKLIIIGQYSMSLKISRDHEQTRFTVSIDYDLPTDATRWLGLFFGNIYAQWCVRQMIRGTKEHFSSQ